MNDPHHEGRDYTPVSGGPTDVSPLGNIRPSHVQTASEEAGNINWAAIEADPDFIDLLRAKAVFIAPATAFFIVYYFLLPIGVGWAPDLMKTKVFGSVNLAYLYALSQFFMAWILAFFYVGVAAGWDTRASKIISKYFSK